MANPKVDQFVESSKTWRPEMIELRRVLSSLNLDEELKWRLPCYAAHGQNVVIIQPFKTCLGLMFFQGALLKDPKKVLVANGPNSRHAKRLEFRSVSDVKKSAAVIRAYVREALKNLREGKKVISPKKSTKLPIELTQAFARKPSLKKAFFALTPGRQRAYLIHFTSAKQEATRRARIAKCAPRILTGRGLTDV